MKSLWKLICVVLIGLSLGACSTSEDTKNDDMTIQDVTATQKQRNIALSLTKDMFAGKFDTIKKTYEFDKNMKEVVDKTSFDEQIKKFTQTIGTVKTYKEVYARSYQGNVSVYVPVVGKNSKCNVQVSLNKEDVIVGIFFTNYVEKSQEKAPDGVKETALAMKLDNGGRVSGMLAMPDKEGSFPVVVMLSGSGPNDMNETIGNQKPFQTLAWELAKQGIATYRFDKRTLENKGTLTDTVEQEYVEDALSAIELMKKQDQIDASKLYLLGHSQGGYVLPMIAEKTTIPYGFIMMSAPARPLQDSILEQVQYLANLDGTISKEEQMQIDAFKKDYEALKDIDKAEHTKTYFSLQRAYMMALKDYDVVESAKKIKQPVLLTQGLRDYQVTQKDVTLWKNAFANKSNWTIKTYDNANHLMSDGSGTPSPKEYEEKGVMNKDFIQDIVKFIK